MKEFNNYSQYEELSTQELLEIQGGEIVDRNSTSYKIGHAIGTFLGACEASLLKVFNKAIF
jgi:hypothetical protein